MLYLLTLTVIRSASVRPFVYIALEQFLHFGVLDCRRGDDATGIISAYFYEFFGNGE